MTSPPTIRLGMGEQHQFQHHDKKKELSRCHSCHDDLETKNSRVINKRVVSYSLGYQIDLVTVFDAMLTSRPNA